MQNQRVWTAGSKLGKSKGLNIKNWAFLELFLKAHGLRVDFGKGQGLFNKIARAKGMGDSRPLFRDRVARV